MKLSKRKRYILKWNGPHCLTSKARRQNKAYLGKGSEDTRDIAFFYECRYRGHGWPTKRKCVFTKDRSVVAPNRLSAKRVWGSK